MTESNKPTERGHQKARAAARDITPVLKGWDYESGTINVRKITGRDGRPKLQMRLDLGLLQMELHGRPDGARPHGCDSLLEYFESLLKNHEHRNGTDLGFHLTSDQCQTLREEAVQYYHRYLSLFVLEDFDGVVRDTARNLRVLELCAKFGENEHDRMILEQYRPYITMMNARGKASLLVAEKRYDEALKAVRSGLAAIKSFFVRYGQERTFNHSGEAMLLKKLARDIKRKMPIDPIKKLESALEKAVKLERYEEAAALRDQLKVHRDQSLA